MEDCYVSTVTTVRTQPGATPMVCLSLTNAHRGFDYKIRILGQDLTWRVIADGNAGDEVRASGALPSGTPTTQSIDLPGTWGAARLRIDATLTTGPLPTTIAVEMTWRQVIPGRSPTTAPAGGP
ncbi:MAG: hypothetical protein HDKAJFGB_00870 [Anaerolineae bacterium]|nr:hypothetical protein [Anaerolineae bacterium]